MPSLVIYFFLTSVSITSALVADVRRPRRRRGLLPARRRRGEHARLPREEHPPRAAHRGRRRTRDGHGPRLGARRLPLQSLTDVTAYRESPEAADCFGAFCLANRTDRISYLQHVFLVGPPMRLGGYAQMESLQMHSGYPDKYRNV